MRTSRRGFSLMEILVVIGLLGLMAGLAVVNGRGALSHATSRALADRLAAEIGQARAEAIRDNVPVAVVFPSSQNYCQGIYILRGQERGVYRREVDWSSEARGVGLFWGYWTLDGAITEPNQSGLPSTASRSDAFDPFAWITPVPSDAALIFTPSGACTSNGMVHFDGAYHIVAMSGASTSDGSPPAGGPTTPLTYRSLDGVSDPVTISVSYRGDVKVSKGLVGAPAALAGGASLGLASALPNLASGANSDPVVDANDVAVLPEPPDPSLLPPGVMASCDVNRYLTIRVAATDPDGDTLYTDWTANQGVFSTPGRQAMEWSPQRQRWETSVEWRPPTTATDGQIFDLNCTVTDGKGGSVVLGGDVVTALKVVTADDGLLIVSERYSSRLQLFNSDGSGLREIDLPDSVCTMSATPDGERLVFSFWGGGPLSGAIASMNLDNNGLRIVATPAGLCEPRVAPSGRIAYTTPSGIYAMNGDGSSPVQLTTDADDLDPQWSPDEKFLIFNDTGDASAGLDNLHVLDLETSNVGTIGLGSDPVFKPQGGLVAYKKTDGIYVNNTAGTSETHLVNQGVGGGVGTLVWSPDGEKLAWIDTWDGSVYTCDSIDGSNVELIQQVGTNTNIVWAR